MRHWIVAALYSGGMLAANGAWAQDLAALAQGDMRKLQILDAPAEVPEAPATDADGAEATLQSLRGEVAVVNFWATWCAPCRQEMPTLAKLAAELEDEGVRVVPIAVGRNDPAEIDRFLTEAGAADLPRWRDPSQGLARGMGVLGLPVTVILNREGQEVARLTGDADWSSESALAILRALAAEPAPQG